MHTRTLRVLVVTLSGLALLGCTGEAEWSLAPGPTDSSSPAAPPEQRTHVSSFQGLSAGLPSNAKPLGIAQLDGTVYLVSNGLLFSLASGSSAWTQVELPLLAGEQATSVTRVELAILITTTEGLLRLDWGSASAARLSAAPKPAWALVKKGSELLLASSSGLFASGDNGATFVQRSTAAVFSGPVKALVASAAAQRLFAAGQTGGLFYSDDAGRSWTGGLVAGEITALSAAGEFVLVESTTAGTLRSDNYGNTFHPVTLGAPGMAFGFSGKKAFAATMSGMRVSDDGGNSWSDGNDGLPPSAQVTSVFVAGPAVVAATPTQVFVAELF